MKIEKKEFRWKKIKQHLEKNTAILRTQIDR